MDRTFIKRRYYDMRLGGTQVSPIIQLANFVMITFMWINHIIPVEIFAPLMMVGGFIMLSYVGVRFRKHQATTDHTMIFEKQQQLGKALYYIMENMDKSKASKEFLEEYEYLKTIAEGNK